MTAPDAETPGDGSAAVPSEPRRWTLSGEDYGVPFGCVVTRGPALLASDEVTVEEVGPVSEAEVEAGARALYERAGGTTWDAHADAVRANYREVSRAVLSAAREVKSDGD